MPRDEFEDFEVRDPRKRAKEVLEDSRHDAPPPGKEPLPTDTPDERGKPQPDAS